MRLVPTNTNFKNVTFYTKSTLSENLKSNIIEFFNWGFLNIGKFANVQIPVSGAYGGRPYQLRLSEDDRYTKGQVWEGFRKQWIWESGTECPTQPISISGVFVNNTFYPLSTTGAFAYKIDYPNGRVVFNTAIASTSTVKCAHSYRYIQIYDDNAPWYKTWQEDSQRSDSPQFNLYGSGLWSKPPEQRVQLPAIVVESTINTTRRPREIGSLSQWVQQEFRFNILAETKADFEFIHDVITEQQEKSLIGFDKNLMLSATGMPLNYDGSVANGAKTYPNLIKPQNQGGYEWNTIKLLNTRGWTVSNSVPYYGVISGIFEVDVP